MIYSVKKFILTVLRRIDPDFDLRFRNGVEYFFRRDRKNRFRWKQVSPSSHPRLDAGGIQVGGELFVFGGFTTEGRVLSVADVFDMENEKWSARIDMPEAMPQSHLGMAYDGERYIYSVSGQLGNQCHPPVKNCFVFDAREREFRDFPPLPAARYAPAVQICEGRLHAMGGSKEDRNTPAVDHWSIGIAGGRAAEGGWKQEAPVPRGGPHRACLQHENRLYVFGGQEGDFVAIPGDPRFMCTGDLTCEEVYGDCFVFDPQTKEWHTIAGMPVAASHTEFSWVKVDGWAVFFGGQHYKDPKSKIIALTDAVQAYHFGSDRWEIIGRLPYRTKSIVTAFHNGSVYAATGQRDRSSREPRPGRYDRSAWKCPFDLSMMPPE